MLRQLYYLFLYFEFRCVALLWKWTLEISLLCCQSQRYICNLLLVVGRRRASAAAVRRHWGFYSTAAPRGLIYFLNPAGNPTKQQMHLSNVKARPSNAARITPWIDGYSAGSLLRVWSWQPASCLHNLISAWKHAERTAGHFVDDAVEIREHYVSKLSDE